MSTLPLTTPLPLLADAGTPLMWATLFHLAIGNTFIGIMEALIVRLLFKVKGKSLFIWLIAANYASSIAGALLISQGSDQLIRWVGGPLPVYHVYRVLGVLALLSFIVTIVIEWPFYWLALRAQAGGWNRSLNATLVANAASYLLLVAWYWLASATPTNWGVRLVRPQEISPNPNARVLYISPDGMEIYQLRLDGSPPIKLIALSEPSPDGVLGFSKQENHGRWRLEIEPDSGQGRHFVADIGPCLATTRDTRDGDWLSPFSAADNLQNQTPPKWNVTIGFWPGQGISVENMATGNWRLVMAIEAPWLAWSIRSATILPNDQLLFDLGDQIIWVDLSRNVAAAIAPGHGPVVVLDQEQMPPSTSP